MGRRVFAPPLKVTMTVAQELSGRYCFCVSRRSREPDSRYRTQMIGMTNKVGGVEVSMPPTMGAVMWR